MENKEAMTKATQEILKKGTIYLFPSNYEEIISSANLPFGKKDLVRDFEKNWLFGFIAHTELPNWYFVGHANRNDASDTYHTGYKKRKQGQPFFHVQNYGTTHEGRLHFSREEMGISATFVEMEIYRNNKRKYVNFLSFNFG